MAKAGRQRKKTRASAQEAVACVEDGARVMVGGFGLSGNPEALIAAVLEKGVRDLHLISNNAGSLGKGLATWLKAGLLREVTCSYLGTNRDLHEAKDSGRVKVNVIPQGTLAERMRAAGAGIPAFYTPTGVGTVVADGKEQREFGGRRYLLEEALAADVALLRCRTADPFGNARFWRTTRNFQDVMAAAASETVLEADRVVALGDLDPDDVHLPGLFVHHVVEVPEHEDPIEYRTVRPRPREA